MTCLNVVPKLDAANEFRDAAIEIVASNVQVAVGPRPTEIRAKYSPDQLYGGSAGGAFAGISAARALTLTLITKSATLPSSEFFMAR
jgi:hypothetical protein